MAPKARARASDSFPPLEVKCPATLGNSADRWIWGREYQDLVPFGGEVETRSDAPTELLLRGLGHHLRRPRRIPDDVHRRLFDALKLLELSLHVLVDVRRRRASRGGERHADVDLTFLRLELDVVHEAEIVNVDLDLGIVALPEDADYVIFRRHVPTPWSSYEGRPILTFRFWCQRLPAREAAIERVPPSDHTFAALP